MTLSPLSGDQHEPIIVLAEDEILIRFDAADVLRDAGMTVLEAGNGAEALDLLRSDLPITALVTDITMPGEPDGLALADMARVLRPGLPVLLASALVPADPGPSRTLRKPYSASQLLTCVNSMLEEEWRTGKGPGEQGSSDRAC
jgi:CheY-like chemotaxis protein